MIVVDASPVIEVLLRTPYGKKLEQRLLGDGEAVFAPHVLDVEIAHVLRRYARSGELDSQRGREALEDLIDLPIERVPHTFVLGRVWELRDDLTAYDAAYVAQAEPLEVPLPTRDRRLATAPGHSAIIEIV